MGFVVLYIVIFVVSFNVYLSGEIIIMGFVVL